MKRTPRACTWRISPAGSGKRVRSNASVPLQRLPRVVERAPSRAGSPPPAAASRRRAPRPGPSLTSRHLISSSSDGGGMRGRPASRLVGLRASAGTSRRRGPRRAARPVTQTSARSVERREAARAAGRRAGSRCRPASRGTRAPTRSRSASRTPQPAELAKNGTAAYVHGSATLICRIWPRRSTRVAALAAAEEVLVRGRSRRRRRPAARRSRDAARSESARGRRRAATRDRRRAAGLVGRDLVDVVPPASLSTR